MGVKQTPKGLIVGMIPEATPQEQPKHEEKAPARGNRKPKEKE